MFKLTGVGTFAKLGGAALPRTIGTPVEEAVGGLPSKLPYMRDMAARAPREGGFSFAAEREAGFWSACQLDRPL